MSLPDEENRCGDHELPKPICQIRYSGNARNGNYVEKETRSRGGSVRYEISYQNHPYRRSESVFMVVAV
jgi:hypothetical protein